MKQSLWTLTLLLATTPAFAAAPNLTLTLAPPSSIHVYETGRYTFTVRNIGNKNTTATSLVIQLPRTHTSPQVYIEGTLGARDPRCALSGTTLTCALGGLARNGGSTSAYFDLVMPYSTAPLVITGQASTFGELDLSNNNVSYTANLSTYDLAVAGPVSVHNRHCTGTGLSSFFECELFPSSISAHDVIFNLDGTLTIPANPDYAGTWSQPAPNRLVFQYTDLGVPVADFSGYGVGGPCFEGATTFSPPSQYMSMYEVCLQ